MTMPESPEDHISSAYEYMREAARVIWGPHDDLKDSQVDEWAARRVEAMSRMATLHLQFASTRSLIGSMQQVEGHSLEDLHAAVNMYRTSDVPPMGEVLLRDLDVAEALSRRESGLPYGFTMDHWREIKETIHTDLTIKGRAQIAIPGGNRFLEEKMGRTSEAWARAYSTDIASRTDASPKPGEEPIFKVWVTSSPERLLDSPGDDGA